MMQIVFLYIIRDIIEISFTIEKKNKYDIGRNHVNDKGNLSPR